MKKNNKSILILVTLFLILIIFLLNTNMIINNILEYSIIFLTKLFPVSFILYIITYMLIEYGLIEFLNYFLHIKSCNLFIFILSFISGFPSGAKYTKLLYDKGLINKKSANILLTFSHFPNILFVLGTVYNIIGNFKYTIYIIISIISSNFLIMIFSNGEKITINNTYYSKSFSNILGEAITYSFKTMLLIYGTSLFFYLTSSILFKPFSNNLYFFVFINGIFDLTNGVVSANLINNLFFKSLFILTFLSFGSISIHMQVSETIGDDIDYICFFKGRVIGTVISIIIFTILFFQ